MPHLPGGLASFSNGVQFVVFPKGSVEDGQIALFHTALPLISYPRQGRSVEQLFFLGDKSQPDYSLFRSKAIAKRFAHVVREVPVERHRLAEEPTFLIRSRGWNERHEPVEWQCFPFDGRI